MFAILEFALILVSATLGVAIIQAMRGRVRRPSLVDVQQLAVLATRSSSRPQELVEAAQDAAFRGWRAIIGLIPLPLAMAVAGTAALVMRQMAVPPDRAWFQAFVAAAIAAVMSVPGTRLMTKYVARHLQGELPSKVR
jgi:hypothetical protein